MKIIQLSTRLSEGGAARVALDLHEGMLECGVSSTFFYGYGPGGGASPRHDEVKNAKRLTSKWRASLNYFTHNITGADLIFPSPACFDDLREESSEADWIHVHGLHSFYMPIEALERLLSGTNARLALTLHDYWWMTGRCAFTHNCEGWRHGCLHCPAMSNYPAAWIDNASRLFLIKRDFLFRHRRRISVISPARHLADSFETGVDNISVIVIPNSCDRSFFEVSRIGASGLYRLALVAADFSDFNKYPCGHLQQLATIAGVIPVVIGRRGDAVKSILPNAEIIGNVSTRTQLANILASCDGFLFVSNVDIFPLSLVEAISAGCDIFATASPAAKEVLSLVNMKPKQNYGELLDHLAETSRQDRRGAGEITAQRLNARGVFSPLAFIEKHKEFYLKKS